MSRLSLALLAAVSLSSLSACDRLERVVAATQGANSGNALAFDAVRQGQSLYVSDILWAHLWSLDFMSRPPDGFVERRFGVPSADTARVAEFARDAKARMRDLQRRKAAELCAPESSIDSRHAYALAYLEMGRDVEHFEKTLILEFFEMLGEDTARQVVAHVHAARLRNDTPASASADTVVFHVLDDRDWQTSYADFCAGAARIAASEAAAAR